MPEEWLEIAREYGELKKLMSRVSRCGLRSNT
jgi:hypothetical protein